MPGLSRPSSHIPPHPSPHNNLSEPTAMLHARPSAAQARCTGSRQHQMARPVPALPLPGTLLLRGRPHSLCRPTLRRARRKPKQAASGKPLSRTQPCAGVRQGWRYVPAAGAEVATSDTCGTATEGDAGSEQHPCTAGRHAPWRRSPAPAHRQSARGRWRPPPRRAPGQ